MKGLGSKKDRSLEAASATMYHFDKNSFDIHVQLLVSPYDKVTPCRLCTIELALHLVKVVMVGVQCILAFFIHKLLSSARVILWFDQAIWR